MNRAEGRRRVVIEDVTPEIDGGRFAIKRTVGETVTVEAEIFSDSHDAVSCVLLYRKQESSEWKEAPMGPVHTDRWRGSFTVTAIGRYIYTPQAWVDRFKSWRCDLQKKIKAQQDMSVDLLVGATLAEEASQRISGPQARRLQAWAKGLRASRDLEQSVGQALDEEIFSLMARYPDKRFAATYDRELAVVVDRKKGLFSAWYEMFPRSCSDEPGKHATLRDCEARLPYVAQMGFDVLYLPPIHPIGHTHRKGKNNAPTAESDDPGSPWAIGSREGGHKDIHPQLGTLKDFRRFVKKAEEHGLEVALDIAVQCSPDHPYVKEHPEWFRWRPDGAVQYAENPPKKYEDIYPFDFETANWQPLWEELRGVFLFWIEQGIYIFRIDNPHTKPFCFWEWLIAEIKKDHPQVIFLAEAFTRPKVLYRLAKIGFTQSYTYFAWRNTGPEIQQYLTELTQSEVREFLRPNLWPNTPDILTEYLQMDGKPAFMIRLVLAATLSASYGIYGPAFELCENRAMEAGSEEYLNSEKFEVKYWDLKSAHSLKDFVARVNRIRLENAALQNNWSLRFHSLDNQQLICFTKHNEDFSNIVLVIVNLDPHHTHRGWLEFPYEELEFDHDQPYQVHDLLTDARYLWYGSRNYVELDPQFVPAHIFRIRRRVRRENDFDYYM
jgi:starch synthase (maltosyl-transferring)